MAALSEIRLGEILGGTPSEPNDILTLSPASDE